MAKRKGKTTGIMDMMWDEVNPYGRSDEAITQQGPAAEAARHPIASILPDPAQPRRFLPELLAASIQDGRMTPQRALAAWREMGSRMADNDGGKRQLDELERLADSIGQHGLINPITIRPISDQVLPDGVTHVIVTGERRFWAHIWLMADNRPIPYGNETHPANEIAATVVPEGITVSAHQMIENLMREDMNAVEKAQGLWALRYELSDVAYRLHAEKVKNTSLIPWKQVEAAVGMTRQHRSRLINVLNLDSAAQELVAEHSLAEMTIRPIISKLKPYPELQLRALQQLLLWQTEDQQEGGGGRRIVASVKTLVDDLLAATTGKLPTTANKPPVADKRVESVRGSVTKLLQQIEPLNDTQMQQFATQVAEDGALAEDLRILRTRLTQLLGQIE